MWIYALLLVDIQNMKTIAIAVSKGGNGKSATAHALASYYAKEGQRTLLVGTDPQSSVESHCGYLDAENQSLLLDALSGEIEPSAAIVDTNQTNLHLVPCSWRLYSAGKIFADDVSPDGLLANMLENLEESFDMCVIDTPPSIGLMNYMAFIAAKDGLIVPIEPSHSAMTALKGLLKVVKLLHDRRCETVHIAAIVPTRVPRTTKSSGEAIQILRDTFSGLVTNTTISEAVAVRDCVSAYQSIFEYKPKSKSAKEYAALAEEVLERITDEGKSNVAA